MSTPRDPRWVLLAETGEYSILGRHREPNAGDISKAKAALARAGKSGWIAIMSHSVQAQAFPELFMVCPLRTPSISFEAAVQAFRRKCG